MINLAGRDQLKTDELVHAELLAAGIRSHALPWVQSGEVKTCIIGSLGPSGWGFRRAWTYWIATGPGIPPEDALALYNRYGQEVRVAGNCRCPSPIEWYKGFGVQCYHVDSADGLKALAELIKKILKRSGVELETTR